MLRWIAGLIKGKFVSHVDVVEGYYWARYTSGKPLPMYSTDAEIVQVVIEPDAEQRLGYSVKSFDRRMSPLYNYVFLRRIEPI